MPEMSSLRRQDRKDTWRFRPYSGGFAMDFDYMTIKGAEAFV
jgi:hypothetical protein